jgi:hypothetical protein
LAEAHFEKSSDNLLRSGGFRISDDRSDASVDPTTREPFFASVQTIDSSYESKRVLVELVRGDVMGREMVQSVLEAVATMTSDYEPAETLLALLKRQPLDSETRDALLDVTDKMRSDYEQGRVLVALVKSERR